MVDTKWILIQTGRERDFSRVKNAVESFGREATVVTLKQVYEGTSLPESTNSVVYGPVRAVEFATATYGWLSWLNLPKLACTAYFPVFGQHLVNSDYVMLPLGDVPRQWNSLTAFLSKGGEETLFVKPNQNNKLFVAGSMCVEEVRSLRNALDADELVVISGCKEIHREWRCFILNTSYLTGSLYRDGDNVSKCLLSREDVIEFANAMAQMRYPELPPVWVIDVAETEHGLRVLEVSDSASAGFYEADHDLLIKHISLEADSFHKQQSALPRSFGQR